jgi:hypothetical protein
MTVQRLGQMIGISLAVWVMAAYPAYRVGGEMVFVHSAVAAGICLVPAVGTFLLARLSFGGTREQRLLFTMLGTGLRMFVVLAVVMLLHLGTEYFRPTGFVLWVLGFYLLTLGLEVVLLVQEQAALDRAADPS